MSFTRPLLAGAVVLSSFAGPPAADAACHGSQQFALVCVTVQSPYYIDPSGSVDDCIVVNSQCTVPYSVPMPVIKQRDGEPLEATCTGQLCPGG